MACKNIIYAQIVHQWILNSWIEHRELGQPLISPSNLFNSCEILKFTHDNLLNTTKNINSDSKNTVNSPLFIL